MEARGVGGERASDNWWPVGNQYWPEVSGGGVWGTHWDLFQHSDCLTAQAIIWGDSRFVNQTQGFGPGYFNFGLAGLTENAPSVTPNITAVDLQEWLSFRQGVDSRRAQKGKGLWWGGITAQAHKNYKVFLMAFNTLQWVGTTWLVPTRDARSVRTQLKEAIRNGAQGIDLPNAEKWIFDYYLPSYVRYKSGTSKSPVFWQLNGKGRGNRSSAANRTFMNDQIRSWCQGIVNFISGVFPGRTWEWFIDNNITWGELEYQFTHGSTEAQTWMFPQLENMGLLDRLERQQTAKIPEILNQPIVPWTQEQWNSAFSTDEEE